MPAEARLDVVARTLVEWHRRLLAARATDTPPLPGEDIDRWRARRARVLVERARAGGVLGDLLTGRAPLALPRPPRRRRARA